MWRFCLVEARAELPRRAFYFPGPSQSEQCLPRMISPTVLGDGTEEIAEDFLGRYWLKRAKVQKTACHNEDRRLDACPKRIVYERHCRHEYSIHI